MCAFGEGREGLGGGRVCIHLEVKLLMGCYVVLGCCDRAEICKLIGTYLLNQINNVISKESIGLIRDDELVIFKNISVPEVEKKKENLIRTFKTNRLSTIRFKQIERCWLP